MIILASNSPRRKEILTSLNIAFKCIPADIDENINLKGKELVMELAKRKACVVYKENPNDIVLGSDTIVVLDDKIYGKPKDEDDCFNMLKELSNRTHSVITGVCITSKEKTIVFYDEAFVTFREIKDREIYDYINTNEPFDKAGGYAIQGIGNMFIKEYKGDFYTIMGLPKKRVEEELKKFV